MMMATVRGGKKLVEKMANIRQAVEKASSVKIGFLEGATYPSGGSQHLTQKKLARVLEGKKVKIASASGTGSSGGQPVAMIAAIQEFGAPSVGIPPRPFFRNMIAKHKGEWPKAMGALLKANNYDAAKTLAQTGEAISGQLRQSIIDTNEPPLKPATIKRKGFAKPLIDTSNMINSISYEVNE